MSFRARLLVTSLAVLAVGLGALLVAGNALLAHRVGQETTDLLESRVQAEIAGLVVTRAGVRVRETPNDAELDRRAWVFDDGEVSERPPGVPAALDAAAVALGRSPRAGEVDGTDDERLRVQPLRAGGRTVGAVVVAQSTASLERLQQGVLVGSLVIAALVLAAGALAVSAAVAGALRPVAEMTARAEDWGAHDLERRFGLGPPRDELTGLAATLDRLLARIAASRRHEQRFADDVAHELRTPVAALSGRAELALDAGPDEQRSALAEVVAQARRLDRTIDTLLTAARRELDGAGGEVDLVAVARAVEGVEVVAPTGLPAAAGDRDVVARALAPLVENARRHARGRVTLELTAAAGNVRLAVRDDGPGVDPALGERVFEPGVRAPDSDGAGLGLPLARRLARACGGDVVLEDGGFVLVLPAV